MRTPKDLADLARSFFILKDGREEGMGEVVPGGCGEFQEGWMPP